jgi:hypothetical protein
LRFSGFGCDDVLGIPSARHGYSIEAVLYLVTPSLEYIQWTKIDLTAQYGTLCLVPGHENRVGGEIIQHSYNEQYTRGFSAGVQPSYQRYTSLVPRTLHAFSTEGSNAYVFFSLLNVLGQPFTAGDYVSLDKRKRRYTHIWLISDIGSTSAIYTLNNAGRKRSYDQVSGYT